MSLTSVPSEIIAGTTHEWEASHSDYPSSTYTLTYVFYSSRQRFTVTGVASGSGWTVTLTNASTATWYPGAFAWQAFTSKSGARHAVASGRMIVLPDVADDNTPPTDAESYAARQLKTYTDMMKNESFVKTLAPEQIAELERVRKQFEWDVKRERDAAKLQFGEAGHTRKILTRFA